MLSADRDGVQMRIILSTGTWAKNTAESIHVESIHLDV